MLTAIIENLLNRNLPQSPRARELCMQLAGRRVALNVEGFGLRFVAASAGDRLTLTRSAATTPGRAVADDSAPDAEVRGTPLNLLALLGPDPEAVIRRSDVTIDGDAETVQRFRDLGRLLRPDIEEELSRVVGDAAAHQTARAAASLFDFGRRIVDTGTRNVAEYLAHERADLVPSAEAAAFCGDVDRVREDVDRLAARIELVADAIARRGKRSA
jgi:ubiquinone biosynthesis protein UbiJ